MRKAFLMSASITVKSNFMIVYQNPLEIFCYSSLYAFMPLFLTGKVKYLFLIWRCADKYIGAFSIYAGICTVCMQNQAGQQVCKDFFRSVSDFNGNKLFGYDLLCFLKSGSTATISGAGRCTV